MNGQWVGLFNGSSSGTLVIELDDLGTHYEGWAYAYEDDPMSIGIAARISTPDKSDTFLGLTMSLCPTDSRLGAQVPLVARVNMSYDGSTLKLDWKTDWETFGSAVLDRSRADDPSEYTPLTDVTNWDAFKEHVNGLEHRRFVFRGQSQTKRLRTSFHRTGRADLHKFLVQDIPALHRHLSLRTSHIFNLDIANENGAFFNLVQHHGYPTPLLDWTYSPFVSAFFAYHHIRNSHANKASNDEKVRIFVFDQELWKRNYIPVERLTPTRLHFSVMEFIAINNERMIPQQAVSSVTNIDDIETYIRSKETTEKRYLRVIDLPVSERPKVMRELSTMGITSGSLFPGLDGACEELRERFFQL